MATGDIKIAYGTSTSIVFASAFDTLASSATVGAESDAVDNSTNKFLDALVAVTFQIDNVGAPANDKTVYIYAAGSEDGTNYTDNATGAKAAITLRSPTNLSLIGAIACPTQNLVYRKSFSVAAGFGGILPRKWSIIVLNYTGRAFLTTTPAVTYTGVYTTVAS